MTALLRVGSYLESTEGLIQTIELLQGLLTTEKKPEIVLPSLEPVEEATDILVNACKSGKLLLIAHALNAFYDIFSEPHYNQVIASKEIMPMMQAGLPQLQQLYKVAIKEKTYAKREIEYVEESLINLQRFIDYKRSEMKI